MVENPLAFESSKTRRICDAFDDAWAFLQAVVAATSRNRPRTPIFPVAGMGCGKATSRANRLLPS